MDSYISGVVEVRSHSVDLDDLSIDSRKRKGTFDDLIAVPLSITPEGGGGVWGEEMGGGGGDGGVEGNVEAQREMEPFDRSRRCASNMSLAWDRPPIYLKWATPKTIQT